MGYYVPYKEANLTSILCCEYLGKQVRSTQLRQSWRKPNQDPYNEEAGGLMSPMELLVLIVMASDVAMRNHTEMWNLEMPLRGRPVESSGRKL